MREIPSWPVPEVPRATGRGEAPVLFDPQTGELAPVDIDGDVATLYVCGITPYDATHLGHAATYLAFDTLQRAWRDAGIEVRYAQNVTDVDDPLLERAERDGVDWRVLAQSQTDLFREDMTALRVIPPKPYARVADVIDETAEGVERLLAKDLAYRVPIAADATPRPVDPEAQDVYFDVRGAGRLPEALPLGAISGFDAEGLDAAFREFGGDPERPGKRDPLDPLLWRAAREGEPAWETPVGAGRPGWHVECAVIATEALGAPITLQGGGRDLRFPHHEMSAAHATAMTGERFARRFAHAGLVAYEGEKMSKSKGNLVLVSRLRAAGADPAAIRLAILAHRYRDDWEWTDEGLAEATERLARWREAAATLAGNDDASQDSAPSPTAAAMRRAMADDLDTPAVLAAVDAWAADPAGQGDVPTLVDALLGIRL
ncbi:L-cysteine:1D-myo-inositol 2-amino-2-deoxy-alpha-D-glucopyranoside ligase [Pseudoclavibacter triregionum]|nr:L-cysteine:1D-myo-inositol 2-amino-2-deoxy-alpha-D-glucopyranoside ligase [Pseudoclavibacter triregionum]